MKEQAERIEQAIRVLESMDEHARTHHFTMSEWGRQTDCGTVGCVAGHCSLDPWFREHGWKGGFGDTGEIVLHDGKARNPWSAFHFVRRLRGYFGKWAAEVMFNPDPRPVETVIAELKQALQRELNETITPNT